MSDDRVIDIRRYLGSGAEETEPGAFGVWGGAGERSRFALPVWRSIYLAGGDWGGIVYLPEAKQASEADGSREDGAEATPEGSPFFILDLHSDPVRTVAPLFSYDRFKDESPPTLLPTPGGGLAVLLGSSGGRWWFLLVQGEEPVRTPEGKDLETLLFLAGECSGLLFLRELEKDLPPA